MIITSSSACGPGGAGGG